MYVLNVLNTATVRTAIRALALAAVFAIVFATINFVVPIIVAAVTAALTAAFAVVVAVGAVLIHAATYAVTLALWCAVRGAIVVMLWRALPVVVPVLWRVCVATWRNRDMVLVAAKGLTLVCVVVGVFVTALVYGPVLVVVLGKVAVVAVTMTGAVASVKVM